MWTCKQCGEQIEDQFDSCWRCAGEAAGDGGGQGVAAAPGKRRNPMRCSHCEVNLDYAGTKRFRETSRWRTFWRLTILGEIGELFEKGEAFDLYLCSRCGRVEFFLAGIGEEFRPKMKSI